MKKKSARRISCETQQEMRNQRKLQRLAEVTTFLISRKENHAKAASCNRSERPAKTLCKSLCLSLLLEELMQTLLCGSSGGVEASKSKYLNINPTGNPSRCFIFPSKGEARKMAVE